MSRNRKFDESYLESANESMAESLASKVGQLKSLAIDLEDESRDHLPLLDGLDEDMDGGSGRMGGTMGRLRGIGRVHGMPGPRISLTVAAVTVIFLFFLAYFILPVLMSRSRTD